MSLATWKLLVTLVFFVFYFFISDGEYNFHQNARDICEIVNKLNNQAV